MGLFDDIGSFVEKGVKSIGNYYGIDNNGKFSNSGGIFKWIDEGVGEVTGRNQSRASLNLARDQYSYAHAQAAQLIQQQQWNRQQGDIMGSQSAGAATRTAQMGGGANFSNTSPTAMGPGFNSQMPQKDFLGL